ncbi:hypothetical protein SAMN05444339_1077 [Loktanella atrilutea]|uniref:Uncharacterized protein n=2 Tax=Loktanella atrilutea TaxID=366533 RepID=A0A1M5C4L4_LOKAT|nr:hypothetical protein SAMN05444339_1077 [Loktanella atrilutea]
MHSHLPDEGAELDTADTAPDPDAFVYFVDPEELALLSPGWPEEMRLLLCMDATGLCEFVVFHDEEEPRIFGRVTEILDRPVGAFAVSPQVEGYPTRRLLFSEENALLKSIQDSSSLRETAEDYLINYNFAREESLDFEKLMRTRRVDDDSLAARVRTDKIFAFGSRNAPKKRAPQSSPPAGYLSTEELSGDESHYVSLEMWLVGGRVRIARKVDFPLPAVPTLVREIALRDDFSSIYIPRNILPARWHPKDDMIIDIPIELFPAGFADNCGRRKVQVAVMPRGVFVEFGALIPAEVDAKPDEPEDDFAILPRQTGLRAKLKKNFHIPLIAVAGLTVASFFSMVFTQAVASETAARDAARPVEQGVVAHVRP